MNETPAWERGRDISGDSYLKHWLDGMAGDSKFIFKAASQASKAVDYLLSFSRKPADIAEVIDELVMA